MKNKNKNHSVEIVPVSNIKIVERDTVDTPNVPICPGLEQEILKSSLFFLPKVYDPRYVDASLHNCEHY